MAISAAHDALGDLAFRLSDALAVANVPHLVARDMVEVQRGGMSTEAAIGAPCRQFVGVEPPPEPRSAFVRLEVAELSVDGISQPHLAPVLRSFGIVGPVTLFAISRRHLFRVAVSPVTRRRLSSFWMAFTKSACVLARSSLLFLGSHVGSVR